MNRSEFTALLSRWLEEAADGTPAAERPIIVGLSGAQGSGKTTIMADVCRQIVGRGRGVVALSIDDFYLTHHEQLGLARRHPGNRFLQHRGYPGTHDVALGVGVLTALRNLRAGSSVKLPGYDRSAFEGTGDRLPESDWREVAGPLDLVVLEGWMLGFTPAEAVHPADSALQAVNELLRYYTAWHALLDGFIWLEPEDHMFVREWRVEAEVRAMAAGRAGMGRQRITAFVDAFLPAYALWTPGLRECPPTPPPHLHVIVGRDRLPTEVRAAWQR
jgi:D-glycerate 3-kinase